MRFEDYHAECMADPEYRFWHYFYAVVHFPRRVLVRFLFWLRDASEDAAFRLMLRQLLDRRIVGHQTAERKHDD